MFAIISTSEQLALARRGILIHGNCYSTARDKCYTVNYSQKKKIHFSMKILPSSHYIKIKDNLRAMKTEQLDNIRRLTLE